MSTHFPSGKDIKREWFLLDAENAVLGRVASQGREVVDGEAQAHLHTVPGHGRSCGRRQRRQSAAYWHKEEQKVYRRHSGYPGGLKEESARKVRAKSPARLVELAVAGMLPKTKLGKHMIRKLKVYAGDKHPHEAQKPVSVPATEK